jgi:hypothetical protein
MTRNPDVQEDLIQLLLEMRIEVPPWSRCAPRLLFMTTGPQCTRFAELSASSPVS